jgi:dTDP-4-dehydrorhamnose reductase
MHCEGRASARSLRSLHGRRPIDGVDGHPARSLELWGGVECTVNRVGDQYFNQLARSGHAERVEDLSRFASLGILAIRYPVLWELTAPGKLADADWTWPDERLNRLRELEIKPIVGLLHHGSGPRHTNLLDPGFAQSLAEYAGTVASRYPWIERWTPINEPLTTARFCALYGLWYPHARDDRSFVQALLNQCRATVLAMRAIRQVIPAAKLIQTDDLGKTYGTEPVGQAAAFYNERRWLSWDLLCGSVNEQHPLWPYLLGTGIEVAELRWLANNPCPPDVVGVNHYVTGERWLDDRPELYPARYRGVVGDVPVADIEAARAFATPTPGASALLAEVWERYGLPIAVTEVHIDAHREDQLRWFAEIWHAAEDARRGGADVIAVTAWAMLGSYDWNCLVQECRGYYEPGPFDVRSRIPRPTALATLLRSIAAGATLSHPVLQGEGWWLRPGRFFCKPVVNPSVVMPMSRYRHSSKPENQQPILISGASGTLGQAFARICRQRNLQYRLLSRREMDIADSASVETALARYRPWALINASGYVRIDEAEVDAARCFRENAYGPALLATKCRDVKIPFMTFSSDQVFDGSGSVPLTESAPISPLNVYGQSKAEAEREVQKVYPHAIVVRTSSFFGPWDKHNFVTTTLAALAQGKKALVADNVRISPTYVPDLVNVSLDLLIDDEHGLWHVANDGDVSWAEFAHRAAEIAQIDAESLVACRSHEMNQPAERPRYGVLASERGNLMPTLDDALRRFCTEAMGPMPELVGESGEQAARLASG